MSRLLLTCLIAAVLFAAGCTSEGETGLAGTLLFGGQPLAGASLEVYLKADKDRATQPFAVTSSDAAGRFAVALPAGRYFLIAKKRALDGSGRTRMLMGECPANPLEVTRGMRQIAPFSLREMGRDGGLIADPETGVRGQVTFQGKPLGETYVYVYSEDAAGLMGPSYGEAVLTEEDGSFAIPLPAGRYYLAARRRADGARMGEPAPGDWNGSYPGNPVTVSRGSYVALGALPVSRVEAGALTERLAQGKFQATATAVTGRVVDPDGRPVAGVYVYAYLDSRMVGKPSYISAASGPDGAFRLFLGSGGTYYLGARSAFGGPLEPGEWVGTYQGSADHGAAIAEGQTLALGDLVVKEVW